MLRISERPELVERDRAVQRIARQVAEGLVETRETDQRIEQLLQGVELRLRLLARPADDGAKGGHDLHVVGAASMLAPADP